MTIESIIRNGKGSAGSGGAWRVEGYYPHPDLARQVGENGSPIKCYSLFHHGTWMAAWDEDGSIYHLGLGHGSVSDQGGMNTLFRTLGVHLFYSRKGGGAFICNYYTGEVIL